MEEEMATVWSSAAMAEVSRHIVALEQALAGCKAKLKEAEYWLGIYRDETPKLQADLKECQAKLQERKAIIQRNERMARLLGNSYGVLDLEARALALLRKLLRDYWAKDEEVRLLRPRIKVLEEGG